jgi:hypothetical protein
MQTGGNLHDEHCTMNSATTACPLCGAPTDTHATRCSDCGMTLAGVDGRPGPFTRRSLWVAAGVLLAVYLVVLGIVALVR